MIRRPKRGGRIAVWVIFATIFLDFVGFSILIPVLPRHLGADGLGGTSVDVGLILALYMFAMVLFLPVWGWISDRVGRTPVLVTCLVGTGLSFALMAEAASLGPFYVARVLQGFFGASVGTAQAYVTDITSDEERAGGIGVIGAASALGGVFGPALGGALYNVDPELVFLAPALVALIAAAGAVLFLPESRTTDFEKTGWRGLARSLVPTPVLVLFTGDVRSRVYLYLFFHVYASFAALEGMFPLFAGERLAWGVQEVGLFLSYVLVVIVATQLALVSRLSQAFGEVGLACVGLAIAGAGLLLLGQASSLLPLVLAGTGGAVGFGLWFPTFTSLFSKCAGEEDVGEYMARSVAMTSTGRGLGIYLGGIAVSYIGVGAPFMLGGIGLMVALGIILLGLPALVPRR